MFHNVAVWWVTWFYEKMQMLCFIYWTQLSYCLQDKWLLKWNQCSVFTLRFTYRWALVLHSLACSCPRADGSGPARSWPGITTMRWAAWRAKCCSAAVDRLSAEVDCCEQQPSWTSSAASVDLEPIPHLKPHVLFCVLFKMHLPLCCFINFILYDSFLICPSPHYISLRLNKKEIFFN